MGEIKYNGRTYSGLIQANGCFIDTDNVIVPKTVFSSSGTFTYTATEDCVVRTTVIGNSNGSGYVRVDNEVVFGTYVSANFTLNNVIVFLKKGQVISVNSKTASGVELSYQVYGIQQGSNITFLSEYASACYDTNEREVGCWIDGKPVYQRTFYHRNTQSSFSDFVTIDSIANVETIVSLTGIAHRQVDTFEGWIDISSRPEFQTNYAVCMRYANGNLQYRIDTYGTQIDDIYITVQYTKTTDTAGSGKLTPTGFETHHYSTNEQIVGTWIDGKPLYERVFTGLSIALNGNDWVYFNDPTYVENVIDFKAFADNSGRLLNCAITEYQRSNTNGIMFSGITGFNRTVNVIVARFTKTTD